MRWKGGVWAEMVHANVMDTRFLSHTDSVCSLTDVILGYAIINSLFGCATEHLLQSSNPAQLFPLDLMSGRKYDIRRSFSHGPRSITFNWLVYCTACLISLLNCMFVYSTMSIAYIYVCSDWNACDLAWSVQLIGNQSILCIQSRPHDRVLSRIEVTIREMTTEGRICRKLRAKYDNERHSPFDARQSLSRSFWGRDSALFLAVPHCRGLSRLL